MGAPEPALGSPVGLIPNHQGELRAQVSLSSHHGLQPQFPHVIGLAGCMPDFRASQKAEAGVRSLPRLARWTRWGDGDTGDGTLLGDGCVPSSSVDRLKPRGAVTSPQDSTVPIIELCGQRATRMEGGGGQSGEASWCPPTPTTWPLAQPELVEGHLIMGSTRSTFLRA